MKAQVTSDQKDSPMSGVSRTGTRGSGIGVRRAELQILGLRLTGRAGIWRL